MAFTTLPPAGAKLPASTLFSAISELRPIVGRKGSSQTKTSDAVRAADANLTVPLPADSAWDFELFVILTSVANAAGDFSGELAFPLNATVTYGSHGLDLALASGITASLSARGSGTDATSPTSAFDIGCSTTPTFLLVIGRINMGATAGSLTLNWAQQTSNVNGTTIVGGSRLTAKKVD